MVRLDRDVEGDVDGGRWSGSDLLHRRVLGPLAALGFVVYWAVKAAVRNAARDAVDEVVVRLLDYGWQPPSGLTPEAAEIRRQDRAERD